MFTFFKEMRRRNMFRLTGAYVVGTWFLIQASVTLKAAMDLPTWFDTMAVAIAIIGFPIALVLGWMFDLTADGFVRTAPRVANEKFEERKARAMDWGIFAGLIAIAGVMLFGQMKSPSPVRTVSNITSSSVAVLPFANRSANADDAFFADGIHDELLTQLSKISALEVISRTSVMGYRDTDLRIPEIAAELGVAAVLEGAVQRAGDRVRITVQLIDGEDDTHLWAQNYDRELTTENIFDIQAEITQVIASALKTVLSGEEKTRLLDAPTTQSVAAYDHYIKGSLLLSGGSRQLAEDLLPAIAAFDAAIAVDPDFGQAYADKAYAEIAVYWFHQRKGITIPAPEGESIDYKARARSSLDRAQSLAPDALETRVALAYFRYWADSDFGGASAAFDDALNVAPNNARIIAGQGFLERRLGNFDRAAALLAKAHRLDPLTYYLKPELALSYVLIGDFEQANVMMDRAKDQNPDDFIGPYFDAAVRAFQGQPDAAWAAINSAFEKNQSFTVAKDRLNYALITRDPAKIRFALESWPEEARAPQSAPLIYTISEVKAYRQLGETEKAAAAEARLRAAYDSAAPPVWQAGEAYSPVIIPGLLGDVDAIRTTTRAQSFVQEKDQQTRIQYLADIADAYARAGDADNAMLYLERFAKLLGPHVIVMYDLDPSFDGLREHPKYKALKAAYAASQ